MESCHFFPVGSGQIFALVLFFFSTSYSTNLLQPSSTSYLCTYILGKVDQCVAASYRHLYDDEEFLMNCSIKCVVAFFRLMCGSHFFAFFEEIVVVSIKWCKVAIWTLLSQIAPIRACSFSPRGIWSNFLCMLFVPPHHIPQTCSKPPTFFLVDNVDLMS